VKRASAALLLVSLALDVRAGRHFDALVPGTGHVTEMGKYNEKIEFVLRRAYEGDVVARIQVIPSFSPEIAVGVRKNERGFSLFSAKAKQQIWVTEMVPMMESGQIRNLSEGNNDADIRRIRKEYPQGYRDIGVVYSEQKMTDADGQILTSALLESVLSARVPEEPNVGLDGVIFAISIRRPDGRMESANTWSPEKDSVPGQIVALVDRIAKASDSADKIPETIAYARRLLQRIRNLPNKAAEPTRTTVTPAADAAVAPARGRGSP
jgi:hypothetical protein